MKINTLFTVMFAATILSLGCNTAPEQNSAPGSNSTATGPAAGQSAVQDDDSQKDVVKVAVSSPDHTTLVAAIQAAEYVDALSNAGPFTVFAPTNAAFEKLPQGTLDNLKKQENRNQLRDILEYHVSLGVFKSESLTDGMEIGQANGQNIKIAKSGETITVNGANIITSIPASNGIVHVIDAVLLPPNN